MGFDQRAERRTSKYRALRAWFLRKNPLCAECKRHGVIRAAREIDHIIPVRKAPDRFWDHKHNWQGLCRKHHELKTAGENRTELPSQMKWRERIEKLKEELA